MAGLFRYTRHPAYFAEQSFWVTVYLFSVRASGAWLSWSAVGAALYLLLFVGSMIFSESLTLAKYGCPLYFTRCIA